VRVYCAGPLFTPYERDFMSKCGKALQAHGIDAFVPHESPRVKPPDDTRSRQKRCFDHDFGAIATSNAMLAVLNGTEVDDGTACEMGIFYALMQEDPTKKGIAALQQDWRTQESPGEGKGLNAFVHGCLLKAGKVFHSLEEAVEQIRVWQAELEEGGQA
jgi:nucleoside 2-deoxyribosyltransferase